MPLSIAELLSYILVPITSPYFAFGKCLGTAHRPNRSAGPTQATRSKRRAAHRTLALLPIPFFLLQIPPPASPTPAEVTSILSADAHFFPAGHPPPWLQVPSARRRAGVGSRHGYAIRELLLVLPCAGPVHRRCFNHGSASARPPPPPLQPSASRRTLEAFFFSSTDVATDHQKSYNRSIRELQLAVYQASTGHHALKKATIVHTKVSTIV